MDLHMYMAVKIWKACGQSAGKTTPPLVRVGVESPETIRLGGWKKK